MTHDLAQTEASFRQQYEDKKDLLARLSKTGLSSGERKNVALVERIYVKGLKACLAGVKVATRTERSSLVQDFIDYGPKAILLTGSQRGGDFLNNQLRGQWAEKVVLALEIRDLTLVPFGPSAAAMPGQDDHRETIMTFKAITLLEGKRPDLLAFATKTWTALDERDRESAKDWPARLLEPCDKTVVAQALCGIEVKNSTWHYGKRRESGGGPLSITVKTEEIEAIKGWEESTGRPVLFFQVLFDELYCMSFRRMCDAIDAGYLYETGDLVTGSVQGAGGKEWHRLHLDDVRHRCGDVEFPDRSEAVVEVLWSGSVVPYINYRPAHGTCTRPDVVIEEISYSED